MALKCGQKIVPVIGEEEEKQKEFKGYKAGTIRLEPGCWFFTSYFSDYMDRFYDFEFKSSDIVIMTYPKCGTTWMQEIIWTLLKNPNLDNPEATLPLYVRSPFLEFDPLMKLYPDSELDSYKRIFTKSFPDREPGEMIHLQFSELVEEPRIIKTHLPFSLLSPKLIDTCKIVYVARDPKDVAVSYLHHSRLISVHGYVGKNEQFFDHFTNDSLLFSPFWKHLKEGWDRRQHDNVHFCFYEDLKSDVRAEVCRLLTFLEVHRTDKQIDNVVEYTTFEAMKAREEVLFGLDEDHFHNPEISKKEGTFLRKGVTGDWKKKLTMQQAQKIQKWTKENVQDFGPDFKYKS